jgi:hypothetical protein
MVGVREAAAGALADVAAASAHIRPGNIGSPDNPGTQLNELLAQQQQGEAGGGVSLLDAQQLHVVVAALHDSSQAVRLRVLKALSYLRLSTQDLMQAFAIAAARCWLNKGQEQADALASVRAVSLHSPAVARTVATAIAQAHQRQVAAGKQQEPGTAGTTGPLGSDLLIRKEHLIVMRELLAGCQGLLPQPR